MRRPALGQDNSFAALGDWLVSIERIVTRRLVHRLVSERLVERVYDRALIGNVERGGYVECMIELALSEVLPPWTLTATWDVWDLEQRESGARIEVKQSAAVQTWTGPHRSSAAPSFDIAARSGYYPNGGSDWIALKQPQRFADVYIMAWHGTTDADLVDHRLPDQWEFFVVPEGKLPPQQTISLNPLRRLAASCSFDELAERVQAALSQIDRLKAASLP